MVTLTNGDLEQITDAITLAIEDRWAAIEEQHKAAIDTIQTVFRTLQWKTDTLQTSTIQTQAPLVTGSTVLAMEESHLCSLPSTVLVGTQLQVDTGIKLDLAKLPHEALQGLHIAVIREIHHRDLEVHQQLSVAK